MQKEELKLMRKKKTFDYRDKLENFIGVPAGSITNSAHFEMNGNREVIVEGCRNILQYDEDTIRIDIGKMSATIDGRNLNIKNFSPSSLVIEGFILSINFIT